MKKSKPIFFWFTGLTVLMALNVSAHGIRGNWSSQNAMMVLSEYDDSSAVSYAEVEVYGPEDKIPFQTGRTDRNGRFSFSPDQPGEWRVFIDDGMGHRIVLKTMVDPDLLIQEKTLTKEANPSGSFSKGSFSKTQALISGLCIIFGLFGLIALVSSKNPSQEE